MTATLLNNLSSAMQAAERAWPYSDLTLSFR
jgi:hypothetical protein